VNVTGNTIGVAVVGNAATVNRSTNTSSTHRPAPRPVVPRAHTPAQPRPVPRNSRGPCAHGRGRDRARARGGCGAATGRDRAVPPVPAGIGPLSRPRLARRGGARRRSAGGTLGSAERRTGRSRRGIAPRILLP
jgi:hypothetical protein